MPSTTEQIQALARRHARSCFEAEWEGTDPGGSFEVLTDAYPDANIHDIRFFAHEFHEEMTRLYVDKMSAGYQKHPGFFGTILRGVDWSGVK